jgi:transketolase
VEQSIEIQGKSNMRADYDDGGFRPGSVEMKAMANAVRILAADMVQKANSGHPGLPLGMADVATVLFSRVLAHWPQDPTWPGRDRFVLSAGHGCALLYALLHLTGYQTMTIDQLTRFRQLGSHTPGHPEVGPGIEATTGPLGQGFANAVGMAVAEAMAQKDFPDLGHRTYVLVGDGCLMEGVSYEAAALAGLWRLNRLTVLWDDNAITIDGSTALSTKEDTLARFQACGWDVLRIDGHDQEAIDQALQWAQNTQKPTLIACRTIIGFGAPTKAGSCAVHGAALGEDECAGLRQALGWDSLEPFHVPQAILSRWQKSADRCQPAYQAWQESPQAKQWDKRTQSLCRPPACLDQLRQEFSQQAPCWATRKASGLVLSALAKEDLPLVTGSADLAESTQILPAGPAFSCDNPGGTYLHYGVREHAMAGILNGLALHGGFRSLGGTFLTFSDYLRPSLRLSALMELPVIYVMTHDSIALGEDGPTHQPVEHLASLRAMANLCLIRPADAVEVVEAYQVALSQERTPSVLALSRQNLPSLRTKIDTAEDLKDNQVAKGAYVLKEACAVLGQAECGGGAHAPEAMQAKVVDLWATGSEVSLACSVQQILAGHGVSARVISAPSLFLFDRQPESYRKSLTHGPATLRAVIEAGSSFGWHKYVGQDGLMFCVDGFGASAPAADLLADRGFAGPAIAEKILSCLNLVLPGIE